MSQEISKSYGEKKTHFIEIPAGTTKSEIVVTIRINNENRPNIPQTPSAIDISPLQLEEEEEQIDQAEEISREEQSKLNPELYDSLHETSMAMISVVISTVMMMSARIKNIPVNYLIWTRKYLTHCKDRNGERPPNIQEILDILEKDYDFELIPAPKCKCPQFYHKEGMGSPT